MKRSLSFADLKDLGPVPQEGNSQNVRKIQSCAGRFQESEEDLSPDFFDDLLEEFENESPGDQNSESGQQQNIIPTPAPGQPMFTTHDLTALLSFLHSNPVPPKAQKIP
jgi:hypothetical protein